MEFNSDLLKCTKTNNQSNIKNSGILHVLQNNKEKQLVKLSLERKQVVNKIFCNFSCLGLLDYEKMSENRRTLLSKSLVIR